MRWIMFLALFARIEVRATVLLSDPFTYQDGVLQIVSSNRWVGHAGVTNQVKVENGSVKLLGSNSQDVNALLEGQPYTATHSSELYAKFKVRFTTLPSSNGTYFAHFKDGGSGFRARIWALKAGAANGTFRLGISSAASSSPTVLQTDLQLDTDYVVVSRLVLSNAVSSLWINPHNETDHSVSTASGPAISIAAYALRQATGLGSLLVDDIIVSTSLSEVMPGAISNSPSQGPDPQVDTVPAVGDGQETKPAEPITSNEPKADSPNVLDQPVNSSPAVLPPPSIPGSKPAGESMPSRPPEITRSPESVEAAIGDMAVFKVEATGATPMRYQWRLNGHDIPGATNPILELASVTAEHAGEYRVFISNSYGTATSAAAFLTLPVSPPLNSVQITITRLPGTGLALVWIAQPIFSYSFYAADSISDPFQSAASGLMFQNGNGNHLVTDLAMVPVRFFLISWP